jgi:hypothetical protein
MGNGEVIKYDWLISTIPLPSLLSLAGMSTDELNPFESRPIYLWTRPHVQLSYLYVNYISDNRTPVYRQTTRDGRMHFESLEPVMPDDGVKVHRLLPGKIYSNSLTAVYRAELRMQHVLTVGRYGAWNPDELAHETYFEVQSWLQLVS